MLRAPHCNAVARFLLMSDPPQFLRRRRDDITRGRTADSMANPATLSRTLSVRPQKTDEGPPAGRRGRRHLFAHGRRPTREACVQPWATSAGEHVVRRIARRSDLHKLMKAVIVGVRNCTIDVKRRSSATEITRSPAPRDPSDTRTYRHKTPARALRRGGRRAARRSPSPAARASSERDRH
jgi:hypothetical protein